MTTDPVCHEQCRCLEMPAIGRALKCRSGERKLISPQLEYWRPSRAQLDAKRTRAALKCRFGHGWSRVKADFRPETAANRHREGGSKRMGRATRTFKLRLSPAGMDVLIDSHCHLIRTTRCLLAWGTTLHVAVNYLDTVPASAIVDSLNALRAAPLSGSEEHHVGAPHRLWDIASQIAERVRRAAPDHEAPSLGSIYILALQHLARADGAQLLAAFERARPPVKRPPIADGEIAE